MRSNLDGTYLDGDGRVHSATVPRLVAEPSVRIRSELLAAAIETLERVGCQFFACDGPTLEPEPMITCHACATLAQLRVAAGRPASLAEELTTEDARRACRSE